MLMKEKKHIETPKQFSKKEANASLKIIAEHSGRKIKHAKEIFNSPTENRKKRNKRTKIVRNDNNNNINNDNNNNNNNVNDKEDENENEGNKKKKKMGTGNKKKQAKEIRKFLEGLGTKEGEIEQ